MYQCDRGSLREDIFLQGGVDVLYVRIALVAGQQAFRWMRRNCGRLWKIVMCLATKPVQASEHPEPVTPD